MKKLKEIRNELLRLHKTLLDIERANYETEVGRVSNLEFLNLLFANPRFGWLRELSGLVAEIDEVFADKSGVDHEAVGLLLKRSTILFDESNEFGDFKSRYQTSLKTEVSVLKHHQMLTELLKTDEADDKSASSGNESA